MAVAHIVGRGAAELVRLWGEPPLVREPDVTLFGVEELDPPELEFLKRSPMRRYLAADVQRLGAAVARQQALEPLHPRPPQFVLPFAVDTLAQEGFFPRDVPRLPGIPVHPRRHSV